MSAELQKQGVHWATIWGVAGYLTILGFAIYRLAPLALEPIQSGELVAWQWALLAGFVVFMTYSEGYKGFWKQVGPRVAARALYLGRDGQSPVRRILAPIFCMSIFGATRKRLIISWCLYGGIILLVIAVRQLAQPYRGIVDAGVVVGLGMGCCAVVYFFVRALGGGALPVPPDVPEGEQPEQEERAARAVT